MERQIFLMLITLLLAFTGNAEKKYIVKTIHMDGSAVYKLNNRGEVAFIARNAEGKSHIFLYSGGEIKQLTPDYPFTYSYASLDMNDHGHVVWPMWTNEGEGNFKRIIMLWNGQKLVKVKDSLLFAADILPRINNQGTIVWEGTVGNNYADIFAIIDGELKNISGNQNGHDKAPEINNNGWITWHGDARRNNDWTDRVRLSKPGETSFSIIGAGGNAIIDDNNNVVFLSWVSPVYNLMFYDGKKTTLIAERNGSTFDVDNGYVVFSKGVSTGTAEIFLWKDSITTKISLAGTSNKNPRCNSQGMAVWMADNYDVYVYRDGNSFKAGTWAAHIPQINNQGMLAWAGPSITNYGRSIYIAEYKDVFDITGRVVLPNGTPLAGVFIFINGEKAGETGANGVFTIPDVVAGNKTVRFSKPGYTFSRDSVVFSLSGNYQVDPDIVASVSTQADQLFHSNQLLIYPNPAADYFTLTFSDASRGDYVIKLTNIAGQLLFINKITGDDLINGVVINTSGMKNGLYYVRTIHEQKANTLKLIILKD